MEEKQQLKEEMHHKQLELCTTRPAYRQGRKLTAVKVYTINNESQHLFIYGVPSISLRTELKNLCSKYGQILNIHIVKDYKTELFTECYHVQYQRIQSARIAKRLIDNRSFYGGILHVCYAPEFEDIKETQNKLLQRNKDVLNRLPKHNVEGMTTNYNAETAVQPNTILKGGKRKYDGTNNSNISKSKKECVETDVYSGPKFPDIYQDDPIFNYGKSKNNISNYKSKIPEKYLKSDNLTEESKSIGPQLPKSTEEVRVITKKFIPHQVRSNQKRIVFKHKITDSLD